MLRTAAFVVLTLIVHWGFSADAQTTPTFSKDEAAMISRNEALVEAFKRNPAIVRQLFNTMSDTLSPGTRDRGPLPSADGFDPIKNPDAERLDRASPEAINDLFRLIKQAKGQQVEKPKR